ncbi:hypothetical protein A0J61_07663 [Choanephora cucurbitarum]|uniref:R3H domain-containing protein n=1 Tax=Choanephora cucurbitarum TaxID=101091 RepID=A0A1C7N6M3_9FUNG|nr:hypothetical protein A0J61_07663 [Choanephora cucurbitarum]
MTIQRQSTVIFVHSTAHWESILQQRAQLLGLQRESSQERQSKPVRVQKQSKPEEPKKEPRLHLIGKEGSRRRKRWTNNNFLDHPSAVLYAEDLRPPGYDDAPKKKRQMFVDLEEHHSDPSIIDEEEDKAYVPLSRHIRHDLKKAHISQSLVSNYELQLIQSITEWMKDIHALDNACFKIQVVSNNQFERYVLHTMSRYYGLYSFSETDQDDCRVTFICHPAYIDYVTKQDKESIDYLDVAEWTMPEKTFFDYLFDRK